MTEYDETDYPSMQALGRMGIYAAVCTGGGIVLFLAQIFARFRIAGMVLGGAVCVGGIALLFAKDRAARRAGAIIIVIGTLLIVSKVGLAFIRTIAATLLIMGAVGLIAFGVWNGVQFIMGFKKRS